MLGSQFLLKKICNMPPGNSGLVYTLFFGWQNSSSVIPIRSWDGQRPFFLPVLIWLKGKLLLPSGSWQKVQANTRPSSASHHSPSAAGVFPKCTLCPAGQAVAVQLCGFVSSALICPGFGSLAVAVVVCCQIVWQLGCGSCCLLPALVSVDHAWHAQL